MVGHYHGQRWNSAEIGASLGISDVTARRYLDILAGSYMVRVLPPWYENLAKRQRRSPKVYFRDTGLLHSLLGIVRADQIWSHPKCGASWEGFAMEQILRFLPGQDTYFWAIHGGPELDLLIFRRGKRIGFEFKFSDAPAKNRSMEAAMRDLALDHLWVVYPGERRYPLGERVEALPLISCRQTLIPPVS